MAIHEFQCTECGQHDDRYLRLAEYDREKTRQRCQCGAAMRKVITPPVLKGLDSGPGGFLRGRVEDDGCSDPGIRARLRRNAKAAGVNVSGGVFVPGLCRKHVPEDPFAVVHSRDEIIKKARQLGRCIEGPGMDFTPPIAEEHLAKAEAPYRASERIGVERAIERVRRDLGGTVPRKKFKDMVREEVAEASGNG